MIPRRALLILSAGPAQVTGGLSAASTFRFRRQRLATLDRLGIDMQFLMPSTLYANITEEPAYEAALYRTYNRYMGKQCREHTDRLKWAGLIPMRDARQACEAIEEIQKLGAPRPSFTARLAVAC